MKKTIAIAAALLIGSVSGMTAIADDNSVQVYVTIADAEGKLAVVQEAVSVTDTDGDGALTINDALWLVHEADYEGGASAGYGSEESTYGLGITKLWGTENGGSYGYYVNNISAYSLADTISEGDYINAFVYTDLTAWSDAYSWFDVNTAEAEQGGSVELTLSRIGYDSDWNPVTLPVSGAVITVNGQAGDFVTDDDGKVSVTFETAGENVVSAYSDSLTLVPPVCVVNVAGDITTTTTTATSEETTTTTTSTEETTPSAQTTTAKATTAKATTAATTKAAATTTASSAPQTGDRGVGFAIATLTASAVAAFAVRRKEDED